MAFSRGCNSIVVCVRLPLVRQLDVPGLVQQYDRPHGVVRRLLVKIRVECRYPVGEIRSGIGVLARYDAVQPFVRLAKHGQAPYQGRFLLKFLCARSTFCFSASVGGTDVASSDKYKMNTANNPAARKLVVQVRCQLGSSGKSILVSTSFKTRVP